MKLFRRLFWMLTAVSVFALSSCSDDDDEDGGADFGQPTISVTAGASTPQQAPGKVVTLSIAVTSESGLASVKLNDEVIKTYNGEKSATFNHDYTVPATTPSGTDLKLTLIVTDNQATAQTATSSITIKVTTNPKETVVIEGKVTTSATWSASKYYVLKGNVFVQSGVELTIEPGTVIFGDKDTKGSLIIDRGAKIHAVGTPEKPIIFTSQGGVGFRDYSDWGGVILLGKAVNNQSTDQKIEGISATTGQNGLYGGSADNDNSGEFQYVRIEFGGIALSTDNEINGLTMGSVGSATKLDHVQVSFSGDDSFEWFGGTVNAKYLVSYSGWDDDLDTDFGYTGKVQYVAVMRDPNLADKSGSNAFESDNEGNARDITPYTAPVFSNVTVFGPHVYAALSSGALSGSAISGNFQNGAHIRRRSAMKLYNSAIVGFSSSFYAFNFLDSKGSGSALADVKNNYIARVASGKVTNPESGVATGGGYDVTGFATNNTIEASGVTKVDISGVFTGLTGAADITKPADNFVPAANSILLTGAVTDVAAMGLEATTFKGAVESAEKNWLKQTWINFDPKHTSY